MRKVRKQIKEALNGITEDTNKKIMKIITKMIQGLLEDTNKKSDEFLKNDTKHA